MDWGEVWWRQTHVFKIWLMKMKCNNLYDILNCLSAIILIYSDNSYIGWNNIFLTNDRLPYVLFLLPLPSCPRSCLARLPNQLLQALKSMEQESEQYIMRLHRLLSPSSPHSFLSMQPTSPRLWSKLSGFWKLDNNLNCEIIIIALRYFSELQKKW